MAKKPTRDQFPKGLLGNRRYQLALEAYNRGIQKPSPAKPTPKAVDRRTNLPGGRKSKSAQLKVDSRSPYGPGGSATGSGQGQARQNPPAPEQRTQTKPQPAEVKPAKPAPNPTSKPTPKPKSQAPAQTTRSATVLKSPSGKDYYGPAYGERQAESKVGPISNGQKYSVQKTGMSVMRQQAEELKKMGTNSEAFKQTAEKAKKDSLAQSLKIKQEAEKKRRKGPRG